MKRQYYTKEERYLQLGKRKVVEFHVHKIAADAGISFLQYYSAAVVAVLSEQQSLAIGRGGQNVRLAAKLTGWKIDIVSAAGDVLAAGEESVSGDAAAAINAAAPIVGAAKDATSTE